MGLFTECVGVCVCEHFVQDWREAKNKQKAEQSTNALFLSFFLAFKVLSISQILTLSSHSHSDNFFHCLCTVLAFQ